MSIEDIDELALYMTIGTESIRIILNKNGSFTVPEEETSSGE